MVSWKTRARPAQSPPLSANVAALGFVSMLTAISSAMIYGLLPIFMVRVLDISMASVGLIEGFAEASNSFMKIASGTMSDWIGRRKPLVVFGYALSAAVKTLYPLGEGASAVTAARVFDRFGKGIRDAPRDAFLADVTAPQIRGSGFGLRLSLSFAGFVLGPVIAVALMHASGDDFRLVFSIALIPAFLSIAVLVVAVQELPHRLEPGERVFPGGRLYFSALPAAFWHTIIIASLISLSRFSNAFLVLKAHDVGVGAGYVPMLLMVLYLAYSISAYPFGIIADRVNGKVQLSIGILILICADLVLAGATTVEATAVGVALWGLQLGATQGLLSAYVADSAPQKLRGAAFGIYDLAIGIAALAASTGAGIIWATAGPGAIFLTSSCIAVGAVATMLILQRQRNTA